MLPDHNSKADKIVALCDAVEKARARGFATSKDGDPGPAFEEVSRAFNLVPSTIRDKYYKNKELYDLVRQLAIEMLKPDS